MKDKVAVIGGGFVGLNAAVHAALKGLEVVVIDTNEKVVESINRGVPHVKDFYIVEKWPQARGYLRASTDYAEAGNGRWIIVAVNTPLKVYGKKLVKMLETDRGSLDDYLDFKPLELVGVKLGEVLRKDTLISSEVTIYPGGTMERLGRFIESSSDLDAESSLKIISSPERVNPGDRRWNISNIPRVLGGLNRASTEAGLEFYSRILEIPVAKVTGLNEAELSKLIENSERLVNITLVSSIKASADTTGISFAEALESAATKPFGFHRYRPGYAGGPCLIKDTLMLYLWMRERSSRNAFSELLKHAIIANEMYLEHLALIIAVKARDRGARKILFHGLGYKPGAPFFISEDLNIIWRLMGELKELGFNVAAYDSEIPEKSGFQRYQEAREWADLVIGWGREGDINLEQL